MSGTATPRTRLSPDQRRVGILAAAAAEFGSQGYNGASLRGIATVAGVTTPVIYDHFDSKAELYAAVVQEQADALLAQWARPVAGSVEDVFRVTIDRIFSWVEANPQGWRTLFAEVPGDPVVAAALTAVLERAALAVTEVFAGLPALDRAAELDRQRANAAFAVGSMSAIDGLVAWWWHNPDVPRETVVALATDLLWRGLREMTRTDEEEGPG